MTVRETGHPNSRSVRSTFRCFPYRKITNSTVYRNVKRRFVKLQAAILRLVVDRKSHSTNRNCANFRAYFINFTFRHWFTDLFYSNSCVLSYICYYYDSHSRKWSLSLLGNDIFRTTRVGLARDPAAETPRNAQRLLYESFGREIVTSRPTRTCVVSHRLFGPYSLFSRTILHYCL